MSQLGSQCVCVTCANRLIFRLTLGFGVMYTNGIIGDVTLTLVVFAFVLSHLFVIIVVLYQELQQRMTWKKEQTVAKCTISEMSVLSNDLVSHETL